MRTFLSALLLFFCVSVSQANSAELTQPTGPVILTVTGNIQHTNSKGAALFDIAMLESLTIGKITTETRWHEGVNTFEGPTGKSFLAKIGVSNPNAQLKVVALNDYAVTIPAIDLMEKGLILAMKQNGKYMRIRDKGPLFAMYPFSDNDDLQHDKYYSRAVWQIKAIHVN